MEPNIDYIGVLEYMERNREVPYSNPEDTSITAGKRNELISIKEKGQQAVAEMKKMADACAQRYRLDKCMPILWLDGSNTKTRRYLWAEMKYSRYTEDPISISIFVEYNGERGVGYRISLEIRNDGEDDETMKKYHSYLDMAIDRSSGLVFVSGSNKWGRPDILDDTQENIRNYVRNGEIRKVQLCKYIDNPDDASNDYYHEELLKAVGQLIPYYNHVVGAEEDEDTIEDSQNMSKDRAFGLNTILYGPPGTGKTYNTIRYAVAICDGVPLNSLTDYSAAMKRFDELKEEGRIAFTTFHQSYGYEEFIEGIKPKLNSEGSEIGYSIEAGVFKKFCDDAKRVKVKASNKIQIKEQPKIWGMLLGGTGTNKIKTKCFTEGTIRLGFREVKDEDIEGDYVGDAQSSWNAKHMVDDFKNSMEIGDLVVIEKTNKSIDAIGVIAGNYEKEDTSEDYARSRKVEWLVKDIDQDMTKYLKAQGRQQMARFSLFSFDYIGMKAISEILKKNSSTTINVEKEMKPHVFIVDEINRGNISKIFGELITLIESTKREGEPEAASAILPYSKEPFSVPNNVYILGTMNTADRSIALMDTALRRRFDFEERMPDESLLRGIKVSADGENVDVAELLHTINQRIEYLYDREHTIGHAFFMKLKDNPSLDVLAEIFENNVIPLLQEYFYEDYEKIQLVLGDNSKSSNKYQFVKDEMLDVRNVFKGSPNVDNLDISEKKYRIQKGACKHIQSYKEIGDNI